MIYMKKPKNTYKQKLDELLNRAGIVLDSDQLEKLWLFHGYLRTENERLNMTRIYNFENMVRKHYADSILVSLILKKHGIELPKTILDLGTGPGFPGIPLSIFMPDHNWILAEGRQNRVTFLEEVKKLCSLSNVSIYGKNIQFASDIKSDAVITRAVENMEETAVRTSGIINENGLLIFMKGPNCEDELEEMQKLKNPLFELLLEYDYVLPDSEDSRKLVVYRCLRNVRNIENKENNVSKTEILSSEDNKKYKFIKSLNTGRMIKKHKNTLVCGRKIIQEMILEPEKIKIEAVIISQKSQETFYKEISLPENFDAEIWILAGNLFNQLDQPGCRDYALLIQTPEIPAWEDGDEDFQSGPTVFLPFSDPENLGAALRSCAAFSFQQIVLLEESAHPYHTKTIRSASGEQFHLKLKSGPKLSELHTSFPLFSLDKNGRNIDEIKWPEKFGILTGMEGTGLPDTIQTERVSISIADEVESLNASVSLGIALYEIRRYLRRT